MFTGIAGSLLLLSTQRTKVRFFALRSRYDSWNIADLQGFFRKAIKFLKFRQMPKKLDIQIVLT